MDLLLLLVEVYLTCEPDVGFSTIDHKFCVDGQQDDNLDRVLRSSPSCMHLLPSVFGAQNSVLHIKISIWQVSD